MADNTVTVTKSPASDRDIRQAITEMNELIAEKNRNRDRIRALLYKVKRELDMEPGDFVLSTKLAAKAQKSASSAAATLDTVRRVFLALGRSVPDLVQATEQTPAYGPTIKEDILATITQSGPATTSELRAANKSLASLSSLNTHLSQLARMGAVTRDGQGRWTKTNSAAQE